MLDPHQPVRARPAPGLRGRRAAADRGGRATRSAAPAAAAVLGRAGRPTGCCAAGPRAGSGRRRRTARRRRWTCAGPGGGQVARGRGRHGPDARHRRAAPPRPRASIRARCTCTGARATSSTTSTWTPGSPWCTPPRRTGAPTPGRRRTSPWCGWPSTATTARCAVSFGEVERHHAGGRLPARGRPDGVVLETVPLDMPAQHARTRAVWYDVDDGAPARRRVCRRRGSPARCTPPSTPRSGCCRCSRPATAGTSAGCRPPVHPHTGCADGLRPRRPPRRRRVRRARPRGARALAGRDPGGDRRLRVPGRLPVVRAVAQVRQRQRPARQGGRGAPCSDVVLEAMSPDEQASRVPTLRPPPAGPSGAEPAGGGRGAVEPVGVGVRGRADPTADWGATSWSQIRCEPNRRAGSSRPRDGPPCQRRSPIGPMATVNARSPALRRRLQVIVSAGSASRSDGRPFDRCPPTARRDLQNILEADPCPRAPGFRNALR